VALPGADKDLLQTERQVFSVRFAAVRHRLHLVDAQRTRARRHLQRHHVSDEHLLHGREPGMAGGQHHGGAPHQVLRVLQRAVPRRHVHDPHAPRQSVLRGKPHLAVSSHFLHLISRLLFAGRIWREGEPRDDDSAGAGRLLADGRRNDATHSRKHSDSRYAFSDLSGVSELPNATQFA